jgi:L-rhamnose mutarotase
VKRFIICGGREDEVARICFRLQVKPDRVAEYRARHRDVWPDMQAALRETGWRNYSIFLADDGTMIGYLECDDFERARAEMAAREVNTAWQAEMAELFVEPEGRTPDAAMAPIEEIFHLD